MENRINLLIEIADFLGDCGSRSLLEKWKVDLQTGSKALPFVGRFSAGKSSLLNAVIGTPILPTGRVETTAMLTKIGYSDVASAEIRYADGSVKEIDIQDVANLAHIQLADVENQIESLNVNLPLDILSGGLTIIDSPGIDTIINNHVSLAQYLMNEALIVVYVMSGSPTLFDVEIMHQLQSKGIGIIAVRTHIDSVKIEEESIIQVMDNDRQILSTLPEPVCYFAVSSLPGVQGIGKDEKIRFENYLKNEVARKLNDLYNSRLSARLTKIAIRFAEELETQRKLILNQINKTTEQRERDLLNIENAKLKVERAISQIKETLTTEKNQLKSRAISNIEIASDEALPKFRRRITDVLENCGNIPGAVDEKIPDQFQISLAEFVQDIGEMITSAIAAWSRNSTVNIEEDFAKISEALKSASNIEFDPKFDLDRVQDIADQQEAMLDKIDSLKQQAEQLQSLNDDQLQALGVKREELENSVANLSNAQAQAQEAINYLNSNYEPRYIDKPSKLGSAFKRIGSALDIAMLAIPAVGWEKGATMLAGKASALAAKGGQMAHIGSKALNVAANAAQIMATTDTAKDMTMLIGMGTKQLCKEEVQDTKLLLAQMADRHNSDNTNALTVLPKDGPSSNALVCPRKPSFFDYLSVSYWFGKFGEWIDPPRREIDREYEARYREARSQCEQRAYHIIRQRLDEERRLGWIKNEIEEKERENKIKQEALTREHAVCTKELQRLEMKKERAILKARVDASTQQYSDAVRKVRRQIANELDLILEQIYNKLLSAAAQSAFVQLENLEDSIKQFDSVDESAQSNKKLQEIDAYLSALTNG